MASDQVSMRDLVQQERQALAGRPPQQTGRPDPHPADDDFVVPTTSVQLPSRGRVYPEESPLYLCESLDVKSMTAKEEDILASPSLIKRGTVLSTLMRACITSRSIDPDQLLVGDRNAVLNAIRVSAYGPEYDAKVRCPECEEESEGSFDLSRLPMKTLDVDPSGGPGSNSFDFALPVWKKKATFKLLTGADVQALDRDMERVKKARNGSESAVTMRLMAQVTSIDGDTDRTRLAKMCANMPARDSMLLRAYMDEIAPGVQMEQEFSCPKCGREATVDIPMGTEFFWPSGGR